MRDKDGDKKREANEEERSIKVCVTICKKDEVSTCKKKEVKYCLDFVLLKGDREAFIEHYKELVENDEESPLWPYDNANIWLKHW